MLVDVGLEPFAVALVLPVGDRVADAIEERTAAKIDPANEHAPKMTDVADVIAAGAERGEKLDRSHNRDIRTHGDGNGEREKPDTTVRKKDGVGHKNPENGARRADGGSKGSGRAKKDWNGLDEEFDQPSADSAHKEVVQKASFTPNQLEFAAEHPEKQHVDQEMKQPSVQKDVGEGLPDARGDVVDDGFWNQAEPFKDPIVGRDAEQQEGQRLDEENTRADQNEQLDTRSDEATPIEVIATRADGVSHKVSLRRRSHGVKEGDCLAND